MDLNKGPQLYMGEQVPGPQLYMGEQVPFYNVNQLTPPTIISGKLAVKRVEEVVG